ncbi:MAG: hypothetical protein AAGF55_15990, partial [Pseudomonadota bacterium]
MGNRQFEVPGTCGLRLCLNLRQTLEHRLARLNRAAQPVSDVGEADQPPTRGRGLVYEPEYKLAFFW